MSIQRKTLKSVRKAEKLLIKIAFKKYKQVWCKMQNIRESIHVKYKERLFHSAVLCSKININGLKNTFARTPFLAKCNGFQSYSFRITCFQSTWQEHAEDELFCYIIL